ncbi:MAG TPA: hypothetical protein VFH51_05030, partial [Myxococcota bacterium]|nr:hypothetical protein [Myxococcota bacterium]
MATPAWSIETFPGEQKFEAMGALQQNQAGAGVGFSKIDEDWFLALVLRTELNLGAVGVGLQVPLNLRVIDNSPKTSDKDYYGLIRREDWNEPQKFLRVVRYVRLGHKRDALFLRAGELAGDIGHGTIVGRYVNNLDLNNFHLGLQLDVNTDYGGFETLVSNVGTVLRGGGDSRIIGGRLYVKPYSLVDPASFLNIFAVGATVVTDGNAPATYEMGPNGLPLAGEGGQPKVATTNTPTVYGFDLEAEVMHNALLDLIPYTDLNFLNGGGWGWHIGILATAKLPVGIELTLPVRLEYRRFKDNYAPMYFSTFYELERYLYPVGGPAGTPPTPKYQAITARPGNDGLNGVYGDAALNFMGILQLGAMYEAYTGINPNVAAYLNVPALETLQFKAYYARTGVK